MNMRGLPEWAAGLATFPMRQQGDLDSACAVYCIVAIATWWAQDRGDRRVRDPNTDGHWYMSDLLERRMWQLVLGEKGLEREDRRRVARRFHLKLSAADHFTRDDILAHLTANRGPLLALVRPEFSDPIGRWSSKEKHFDHTVVLVAAHAVDGIVVADPSPWKPRVSLWSWQSFHADAMRNGQWNIDCLAPDGSIR